MKLSLRGLLVLVFIIALILAGTIGYRRASIARVKWLDPGSAEAQMFPASEVVKNDEGEHEFEYYARNRSVQKLLREIEFDGYRVTEECVRVRVDRGEAAAREVLAKLQNADKRPQGAFVVRGKVRTNDREPLANAQIDLMGGFVFINCFKTREDGTFTMALTDRDPGLPAGGLHYFRVRTPGETARWNSDYFFLDSNNPEMVVEIIVPGE